MDKIFKLLHRGRLEAMVYKWPSCRVLPLFYLGLLYLES